MRRSSLPSERFNQLRQAQNEAAAKAAPKEQARTYDLRSSDKHSIDEAKESQLRAVETVPSVLIERHDSFDDPCENNGDAFGGEQKFMIRSLGDDLDRIPRQFADGTRRRASFSMGDKSSDWCKYAQV
jgi:hypothetical protein